MPAALHRAQDTAEVLYGRNVSRNRDLRGGFANQRNRPLPTEVQTSFVALPFLTGLDERGMDPMTVQSCLWTTTGSLLDGQSSTGR